MTDLLAGAEAAAGVPRPKILTKPVVGLMLISVGALSNFYLLFPVVPMLAIHFGASAAVAGMPAGLLMLCTVLVEPVTPYLARRLGSRRAFAIGLLLLGLPAIAPALDPSTAILLVSCALRGLGMGIILVSETSLLAAVLPPERRGEGIGLYGVVIGIPSILFLPFGVGLGEAMGPTVVFLASAAAALLPLIAVRWLPSDVAPRRDSVRPARGGAGRIAHLVAPFAATTIAIGVVSAFLPIAAVTPEAAIVGLFLQSCTTPLARWMAPRLARRWSVRNLMIVGVFVSALGMGTSICLESAAAIAAGMAIFGLGFGVAQYASLTLLLDSQGPDGYDRASAIWNLAYDGGMGLGSGAFGILAAATGFPVGFAIVAGLLFMAAGGVVLSRGDRARAAEEHENPTDQ